MNTEIKRKCRCGCERFNAHQLARHDVVVDVNGIFQEDRGIYDAEHPYGPFTCCQCNEVYEDLDELEMPISATGIPTNAPCRAISKTHYINWREKHAYQSRTRKTIV